nr:hypothetical protein Hi04_10k_c361_00009 [uncultured bacterium]
MITSFLKPLDQFVSSVSFDTLIGQFAKFAVQAGNFLGPQLVKLIQALMQLFVQLMPSGIQVLQTLLPELTTWVNILTPLLVILSAIAVPLFKFLAATHLLLPTIVLLIVAMKNWAKVQAITNALMDANPIGLIILGIAALVIIIIEVVKHWRIFRSVAIDVWHAVKNAGLDVWHWLEALPGRLASVFATVGRAISSPFVYAFNLIRNAWNSTVGGKGFSIPSWVPVIGGDSFRIPYFHTGGIVGGSGDTLAMLKGGEGVFTREQMAAMGGAGSNRIVIEWAGGQADSEFMTWLRKNVRIRGGDPSVLGA